MDGQGRATPRILVLALSGGSGPHSMNEVSQRATWAARLPENIRVLWMKGDASETFVDNYCNLNVCVEERYENLLEKTLASLRWTLQHEDFDFLLRTNTSTYVQPSLLSSHIGLMPRTSLYQGCIGTWDGAEGNEGAPIDYVSGSAILLSRDSARILADSDESLWRSFPDDVAISEILRLHGVIPLMGDRVSVSDYEPVRAHFNTRVKHWTDSSVTTSRMYLLDSIYSAGSTRELSERLRAFDNRELRQATLSLSPRLDRVVRIHREQSRTRSARLESFARLLV